MDLLALRVGYYLPLLTRKSLTRGRPRLARVPLFPGYIFVWGSEESRLSVLKTNRLVAMQHVPDGEQLRRQLSPFAEAIAAGVPLARESRLMAGERVRVKAGLFRDAEGVVLRRNGKTELLIAIDFLRQGASMEIDDCMLEPI
jgi:transcriptional antiterminator RfaH